MKDDKQNDTICTNITTKPTDKEDEPILEFRNSKNEIIAEYEFNKKFTPKKQLRVEVSKDGIAPISDWMFFVPYDTGDRACIHLMPKDTKDYIFIDISKDLYEKLQQHIPENEKKMSKEYPGPNLRAIEYLAKEQKNLPVENGNNQNTDDEKNNNQDKRPEIEWWMILLCLVLVGFIFIIITINEQKEYDEKHNKQAKEINTKPLSYNLDGNKREIEK